MSSRRTAPRGRRPLRAKTRRGSIVTLSAFVMVMVLAFTSFTIDVGFITLTKGQMQNLADAAALGAAMELNPNADQDEVAEAVRAAAVEIAGHHAAGDWKNFGLNPYADVELGRMTYDPSTGSTSYEWGDQARPYNIVRVHARRTVVFEEVEGQMDTVDRRLPLFFGPIIGHSHAPLEVAATASFQPRDIMLVLDYSASMNDDSELRSIYTFGTAAVESRIQTMWEDLDSVTYGNMDFWPDWVTIPGESIDVDVTWRTNEVDLDSNSTIQKVRLFFTNEDYQQFNVGSSSGTYSGTGDWSGYRVIGAQVKVGGQWETFAFYDNDTIVRGLGLDGVPYPYASGSWGDFVEYCRSHSSSMPNYDYDVYAAGHRRKFGMLTLINYWNRSKPKSDQTADLWKVSQQPMQSLKDAVDVLMDALVEADAEDQVGLAVYTHPDSPDAVLESGLTTDYEALRTIYHQRQAGHYDYYTNIGAGIRSGRIEMETNARPKALRMMVLMTDGLANRSSTSASPGQFALDEADLCAAAGIKITTVSLGAGADTDLMQEIADRTGGEHFNVPGGQSVSQYSEQLREVFGEIAADRRLKLIQGD